MTSSIPALLVLTIAIKGLWEVYLISHSPTSWDFNPIRNPFFGEPGNAGEWEVREPFRCHAVCAVEFWATNFHGDSPVRTGIFTHKLMDGRLRVLSGGQPELVVVGILGIESNAVPEVRLPQASSVCATSSPIAMTRPSATTSSCA